MSESKEDRINLTESFYAIRLKGSNEWCVFKKYYNYSIYAKGKTIGEAYLNTIKCVEEEISVGQVSRENLIQNYKSLKSEKIL